ncbi:hypothetical protein [Tumebacillus flagellatus]|uniref:GAPS4 PD-(D/E)XK nuclease domain-containing protein n=1 Tax=Tumebacillus flagellatus TaxID=1157490 RepID=A0A074M7N5_9BACL|nr:hypothetical protein [Tumebacillus flagellatus]KEO82002.1 hypothetical protein EL26_17685 [Tumebacillus flagellatus]
MGEEQKRSGDLGEKIVYSILQKIGWSSPSRNFDIPCHNQEKHRLKKNDRKSHGIDFLTHLHNPLITDVQDTVVISSKYRGKYGVSINTQLKDFIRDIAPAIECLKKNKDHKVNFGNKVKRTNYAGVIFWLSRNDDDVNRGVIEEVRDLRDRNNFKYDSIYLVDNKRTNFLLGSIAFAKSLIVGGSVEFLYPNTSLNVPGLNGRHTSGSILPLQFINSSILPFRITDGNRKILVITVIDNFVEDELLRIIGLAQNLTNDWANETIIAFPDYRQYEHEIQVNRSKSRFIGSELIRNLSVRSYSFGNFRTLEEE